MSSLKMSEKIWRALPLPFRFRSLIIGFIKHPREDRKITLAEKDVINEYLSTLKFKNGKLSHPIIVGMVGLVGSGKSTVAQMIAEKIGGIVVDNNEIRSMLRERGIDFDRARAISESVGIEAIRRGASVVFDSDHIDSDKRASLIARARQVGVACAFVRVVCDPDINIGRIITADFSEDLFYQDARTAWTGKSGPNVVKLREFWRRTPQHFDWSEKYPGGMWTPKKLSFEVIATIDNNPRWPNIYLGNAVHALLTIRQ